jgi:hypothetical protein
MATSIVAVLPKTAALVTGAKVVDGGQYRRGTARIPQLSRKEPST